MSCRTCPPDEDGLETKPYSDNCRDGDSDDLTIVSGNCSKDPYSTYLEFPGDTDITTPISNDSLMSNNYNVQKFNQY